MWSMLCVGFEWNRWKIIYTAENVSSVWDDKFRWQMKLRNHTRTQQLRWWKTCPTTIQNPDAYLNWTVFVPRMVCIMGIASFQRVWLCCYSLSLTKLRCNWNDGVTYIFLPSLAFVRTFRKWVCVCVFVCYLSLWYAFSSFFCSAILYSLLDECKISSL